MKEKILVRACLMGTPCRYDGRSKPNEAVIALSERYDLIPFCPETAGGLPTPRMPAERKNGGVFLQDGTDVTSPYRKGAEGALSLAKKCGCRFAVLKERSPSCGKKTVYDGTFTCTLVPGPGVTTELLIQNKIPVYSEEEIEKT